MYQNAGTPIFYVSILQWLKAQGMIASVGGSAQISDDEKLSLIDVNPTQQVSIHNAEAEQFIGIEYIIEGSLKSYMPENKNFQMFLAHNLVSGGGAGLAFRAFDTTHDWVASTDYLNYPQHHANYNGFSIGIGNDAHDIINDIALTIITHETGETYKLGCALYGTYYEMPHSPDLSLTMRREYDGTKTMETKGGVSLSNTFYSKPPNWGDLGAWELGNYPVTKKLGASGRRVWDLSFSYLDDGDMLGLNQRYGQTEWGDFSRSDYDTDDIDNSNNYKYNILTDNNFYSQVIHKTNGGQLPFVFQPNSLDKTQYAICKLDQSSINFKQVAHGVYNISLKIREVW